MNEINNYKKLMEQALVLAKRGDGCVSPNPMVGALVYCEEKKEVLSIGYHAKFGEEHAEVMALNQALSLGYDLVGKTLITTLEPCCMHEGKKTPACLDLILDKKISKVVIGSKDPNIKVSGKSITILREKGVEVLSGILEKNEQELNEVYYHCLRTQLPFIHLKWAQTLDGKLATMNNNSQWISNKISRQKAHKLRAMADAVLVGGGTFCSDNPSLNIRYPMPFNYKSPRRIIIGSKGLDKIKEDFHLLQDLKNPSLFFLSERADENLIKILEKNSQEVVLVPANKEDELSLPFIFSEIYKRGFWHLLVEGGPTLISSIIKGIGFQKLSCFIAPKILGEGKMPLSEVNFQNINSCYELDLVNYEVDHCGDIFYQALVKK